MHKPTISNIDVHYIQDGNTLGTTDELESINISIQFQDPWDDADDGFVVIKTDGWSMDDISELDILIKNTRKIIG